LFSAIATLVAIIAAFMTSWIEHAKGLKLVRQSNEDC
jgi:hypothetical protein